MKRQAANYEVIGDEIVFHCPMCGGSLAVPVEDSSLPVDCPHCEAEILAPDLDAGSGPAMTPDGLETAAWKAGADAAAARRPGGEPRRRDPEFSGATPGSGPRGERGRSAATGAGRRRRFPGEEFRADVTRDDSAPGGGDGAGSAEGGATGHGSIGFSDPSVGDGEGAPKVIDQARLQRSFRTRRRRRSNRFSWERESGLGEDGEPAPTRARVPHLLLAGGAVFGLGLWLALLIAPGRGRDAGGSTAGSEAAAEDPAFIERQRAAERVARAALSAPDPDALVPLLRQPARVEPILRRYYAARPFVVREPKSLTGGQFIEGESGNFWEFQYTLADGGSATVVVAEADGEFRFDWELFADAASFEWDEFLREQPAAPTALRVTVRKSSMPDRLLEKFGGGTGRGLGLRLWCNDIDRSVFAIVDGDSELGRSIADDTDWNRGRRMILAVSMAGVDGIDTFVSIHDRVLNGWIYPDEATTPAADPGSGAPETGAEG